MFNSPPELLPGETILQEYPATVYMVQGGIHSAGSNVHLFLTNQRILLKAGFGPQRPLALNAIRDVRQEHVGLWDMARLEFADGHLEWFTVKDQAQFLQALEAARVSAPALPLEATVPPSASLGSPAQSKKITIIILIIAAVVVGCICLIGLALGAYMYLMRG